MNKPAGPTCKCGESTPLYWLHDSVWQEVTGSGDCCGLACIECATKCIGRPLTLNDMSIQKYKLSTQHNDTEFIAQYVRCTIAGAMMHYNCLPAPDGWQIRTDSLFGDAITIGQHLASNTPGGESVVDELIASSNEVFPVAKSVNNNTMNRSGEVTRFLKQWFPSPLGYRGRYPLSLNMSHIKKQYEKSTGHRCPKSLLDLFDEISLPDLCPVEFAGHDWFLGIQYLHDLKVFPARLIENRYLEIGVNTDGVPLLLDLESDRIEIAQLELGRTEGINVFPDDLITAFHDGRYTSYSNGNRG